MSREAAIILLDVSTYMEKNNKIGKAIEYVSQYFQKRICSGVADQVSIVLFGADETDNDLAKEKAGFYQHIRVLTPLIEPSIDTLKTLKDIRASLAGQPDYIEALFVAMDMLVKKIGERQSFEKRIVIVTYCGGEQFKDVDDAEIIIAQCKQREIKIDVVGIDFDANASQAQLNENKGYNEAVLRALASEVKGRCVSIEEAHDAESDFRVRKPKSISAFRGMLEISPMMSVAVWSYLKVVPNSYGAPKKVRKKNGEEVKVKSTFYAKKEGEKRTEIAKEDLVKGYKYGKTIISLENYDETLLQYRPPVCLQLIGFTNADNVPRSHYISKTEVMLPYRGDNHGAVAISALVRAMLDEKSVAIVRYVKKANSEPQLGVLLPVATEECDYFYYNKLPFVEDLRQYPMHTLSVGKMRQSFQPSQAQLDAAEELILALDLTAADENGEKHERYACTETYNPITQYMIQTLQEAVVNPEASFPPVMNPKIEALVTPNAELFNSAEKSINNFSQAFPLYVNPEYAKTPKKRKIQYPDNEGKLANYVISKKAKTSQSQLTESSSAPGLSFKALVSARMKRPTVQQNNSNSNNNNNNNNNSNANSISPRPSQDSGRKSALLTPQSSIAISPSLSTNSSNNNTVSNSTPGSTSSFKRTSFSSSRSNSVEKMDDRSRVSQENSFSIPSIVDPDEEMDVEITRISPKPSYASQKKKQQDILEEEEEVFEIRQVENNADKVSNFLSRFTTNEDHSVPNVASSSNAEARSFSTYSSASVSTFVSSNNYGDANTSNASPYTFHSDDSAYSKSNNYGNTTNNNSPVAEKNKNEATPSGSSTSSSNNNNNAGASQSRSLFDFEYDI